MSYAESQISIDSLKVNKKESFDFLLASRDLITGITNYKLWYFIGISEIRRRYKRTFFGPFWTSLSLGIFIGSMGFMLSVLWSTNPKEFLPYFCSGYISWILMQTIITEGCGNFIQVAPFIRQLNLPYTTYACIATWRNLIIFAHHLIIFFLVVCYAKVNINYNFLFLIPALILFFFTGTWVSLFLGMICSRYRDIQQVINSTLQLAMYITPIMWPLDHLGSRAQFITTINPLYHFICLIKQPLLGISPTIDNWLVAIGFSFFGSIITLLFLAKNYRKFIFWL